MQILKTLGQYSGRNHPFYYKRTVNGIYIRGPIDGTSEPKEYVITHEDWISILTYIDSMERKTFRIRDGEQDIESIVRECTDIKTSSMGAYVAAILVHEGSMELYSGGLGPGEGVAIYLKKDV